MDVIGRREAIDQLHQSYNLLDAERRLEDMPSAQPEQSFGEWKKDFTGYVEMLNMPKDDFKGIMEYINEAPSAQPEPCDDPRADVYYLAEKIGIHRLYALVVELRGEPESCEDAVSRRAVQEMVDRIGDMYPYRQIGNRDSYSQYNEAWTDAINRVDAELNSLPSAQPERTCVNCGRTANNGGWYADGRTRCPIEEHYALPKDGYCHLWEKRNVTDDDYPERTEE